MAGNVILFSNKRYSYSVFQSQLKEMNPGAPKIFSTQEDIDNFDRDFWHVLMTSFTVQELSEVFDKGYSNGYPLRLQILVLPKGSAYKIHGELFIMWCLVNNTERKLIKHFST